MATNVFICVIERAQVFHKERIEYTLLELEITHSKMLIDNEWKYIQYSKSNKKNSNKNNKNKNNKNNKSKNRNKNKIRTRTRTRIRTRKRTRTTRTKQQH